MVDNISYGMSTPYYELPAGNALFTFYRAGTSDELLGQTSICRVQAYLQSPPQGFPQDRADSGTRHPPASAVKHIFIFAVCNLRPTRRRSTLRSKTGRQYSKYSLQGYIVYRRLTPGAHTLTFSVSASGLRILPFSPSSLSPPPLHCLHHRIQQRQRAARVRFCRRPYLLRYCMKAGQRRDPQPASHKPVVFLFEGKPRRINEGAATFALDNSAP